MQNFSNLYSSGEREFDKWVDYERELRDSKIELRQMKGLLRAFETMTKDEIVKL